MKNISSSCKNNCFPYCISSASDCRPASTCHSAGSCESDGSCGWYCSPQLCGCRHCNACNPLAEGWRPHRHTRLSNQTAGNWGFTDSICQGTLRMKTSSSFYLIFCLVLPQGSECCRQSLNFRSNEMLNYCINITFIWLFQFFESLFWIPKVQR